MKSVLLIGLGRFGKFIAMKLNAMGHQVMAVDTNEERVNTVFPMLPTHRSETVQMRNFWLLWASAIMIPASLQPVTIFKTLWKRLIC